MPNSELAGIIQQPALLLELPGRHWPRTLAKLRRAKLLPKVATTLEQQQLLPALPSTVQDHLRSAIAMASQHRRSVQWETYLLERALENIEGPIVLLKGAAYAAAQLPLAEGRITSDIDILVPRTQLALVEQRLRDRGWESLKDDEYDDQYYRQWMHELPPLRNADRDFVLDVHHTILPLTGRIQPKVSELIAASRPLEGGRMRILAPEDMVLHATAHLFQDGEIGGGLRDLTDLDALLRHFGHREVGFWDRLVPRAKTHDLLRPLYYALRYTRQLLGTPVPLEVHNSLERCAQPGLLAREFMDRAVPLVLSQPFDAASWRKEFACWLLFVRSHWLRMPPGLLIRHLGHQTWRRWRKSGKR